MDPCYHKPEKSPLCHTMATNRWYQHKLLWIVMVAAILYSSGFLFPILEPFQHHFLRYLKMVWWALLLGFFLAGLIDHYIPSEYISKILARRRKRTVFYSTALGLVMSACSHGILAIAMELHKKGASGPAIISFLLGSPWVNLPVTLLLISLFQMKGVLIIASALFISLTTGFLFMMLDRLGWIEKNPATVLVDHHFSIRQDLIKRWRQKEFSLPSIRRDLPQVLRGAMGLANMILWWIVLGIVLAGLVGAYVPENIFQNYFGPTFLGLLLTLAAATVIEICSEGSAPLAFEIYRQTGSIGNTFVFLMGGFVTDYTEVGLVWKQIGWRTALWMVGLTVPQVLLIGWIYNITI